MANRLSDEQLRESLQEYGEDVGPITPTTRSAWERRLNALRKTKGYISRKITLNALSSDDSEIENSSSSTHRRKRTLFNRPDSGERSERFNSSHPLSPNSSLDGNAFKKPTSPVFTIQGKKTLLERAHKNQSLVGKVKKNAERPAAFEVETSDSDFDTDSSFSLSKSPRRTRRKHNLSSPESKEISPPQIPRSPVNFYNNIRRKSFNAKLNSNAEMGFQPFSPSAERLKRDHAEESYHANGYLSNTLSNGELSEERVEQGSSTNYSHCISWLLLFGTVAFFIIIGVVYVTELQKTTQIAGKSHSKFCNGIKEGCEHVLHVSRELHHLLTTTAGICDCAADTENLKRNLTIQEARTAIKDYFSDDELDNIDDLFNESVLLFKRNPDMGIKIYTTHMEEAVLYDGNDVALPSILDVSALEAVIGSKSLWCRLRISFKWTVAQILLLLCVGFVIFLCFVFTKFWKKRKEAQEKIFYEMVEQVIDILQENSDWSDNEPYKAVVKVRDAIIPPKERKQKLWLWDRVVAFIEENESRISVEYRTINGEDYKVWKWQPTATENEGGKQGKVWQGQAFSSLGKGKNTMYSLSPCLKIRNMFDSEVEYEEGWQVSIQDAILEKCEGNDGIRHIAFDTSTNEGCVYMLCSSTDTSGKAFNDLHGWWFDGKLVTVKYIPLKRYLERFPESEHCTEPLRPSNNKRLSLSTPFFSSALERS